VLEVYGTTLLDGKLFTRMRGAEAFAQSQAFTMVQELGSVRCDRPTCR